MQLCWRAYHFALLSLAFCCVQVNLKGNKLGEEGWCAVFDALRDNPQNKIAKWDLYNQGINPTIAKSLAAYMTVATSLTKVCLPAFALVRPA